MSLLDYIRQYDPAMGTALYALDLDPPEQENAPQNVTPEKPTPPATDLEFSLDDLL
jgi:hypothetical protein